MKQEELSLKEKSKQKLQETKQLTEELNLQLHLGATEASDEFDKQKRNFAGLLKDIEDNLNQSKEIGKEKAVKMKGLVEEMRVQAALGKAETEDTLEEQNKKLTKNIQKLKQEFNAAQDSLEHFADEASESLENYHTKFDLFRLQLSLGKEETKEIWNEKKKDISRKLDTLKDKLQSQEELVEDKWDVFSSEMNEAWKHVKQAFKS